MTRHLLILAALLFVLSCKEETPGPTPNVSSSLEYFGFTLIDTYWDDPLDMVSKTIYSDEVYSFSNVADILVVAPEDDILARMQAMGQLEMKAILHLNEVFFEYVGEGGGSGTRYDLRSDYQARWDTFTATNELILHSDLIGALYIGEEPTWNDIDDQELAAACDYADASLPGVPIMVVEAHPAIGDLVVPESVDWLGFDHYFIADPMTDATFLAELDLLKSRRTTEEQQLVLILDSHYIDFAHGDLAGLTPEDMKGVATSYYDLARSEEDVVALIGYTWPGGFDTPDMLGARQLPPAVRMEYERIGKAITGK